MLDPSKGLGLFTDGSSSTKDRSGGWAFCAIDAFGGEECASGGVEDTTNNREEMRAWIEGLYHLLNYGRCDVLVYSDSEYVGLGAMDPKRNRTKNLDLWEVLDMVVLAHESVEFCHVRGHGDSYYNDLVDRLAGEARKAIIKGQGK